MWSSNNSQGEDVAFPTETTAYSVSGNLRLLHLLRFQQMAKMPLIMGLILSRSGSPFISSKIAVCQLQSWLELCLFVEVWGSCYMNEIGTTLSSTWLKFSFSCIAIRLSQLDPVIEHNSGTTVADIVGWLKGYCHEVQLGWKHCRVGAWEQISCTKNFVVPTNAIFPQIR